MSEKLTIIPDGKHLTDLIHEVDVLHKSIKALGDNEACICWQEDGTLALFNYYDGHPDLYWRERYEPARLDPNDEEGIFLASFEPDEEDREKYTSFARFIQYMKELVEPSSDDGAKYLLTEPVWVVCESKDEANRDTFNNLLGDIEIDL